MVVVNRGNLHMVVDVVFLFQALPILKRIEDLEWKYLFFEGRTTNMLLLNMKHGKLQLLGWMA